MTKVTKIATSCGVVGATGSACTATYMYATSGKTIRDRFSIALIGSEAKNDSLWEARWNKLRVSGAAVHSNNDKLTRAKGLSAVDKDLMKQGCNEIYGAIFVDENDKHFKDFKAYCSLWFGDKAGTFISEDATGSKWGGKLTILKTYSKPLVSELELIKASNERDDAKKGKIKKWCDDLKEQMVDSTTSVKYLNIQEFCIGT